MQRNKFLLMTCFMSITVMVMGQDKGYYSIGNNAEKLKITAEQKHVDSFVSAEKGYYSIETNRRKLKRSLENQKEKQRRVPAVRKGYYSIGNNPAILDGSD